ncbi:cytochrome b [Burkholderia pseudomultivorans]|uniref:cytochrome b n=1 Tax=Burkholderia pseudomultivorans TaxID=1207504 RepID=UPI0001FDB4C2|nr:cytochrome b [Burkholderia pseudomultivorans]EGD03748.1 putative cytochrome b561 [Burkholderia sp. TJI49]KVC36401.1 cytochrome B [Burkholderia pseudomultivorans]KVC37258.1 cytochrome B [Burkholderia pseudomultivorans]KVC50447.1 cytochrome B [Burkholderia pseudomultivorans]KWF07945.1 cytochrome B [Burkholderia pseudomultivorans]
MRNILAKQARYSSPAIFFHWAIFLLVALAYLAIEIRGPKGSDSRAFWMNVHLTAGTFVLVLSVLRVLWRAVSRVPEPVPQPALLSWLAKLAHFALYAFILAQPLLGILMINLGGKPVSLDWLGVSFTLVGPDKALRPTIKEAHELIGNAFYFVIGLHALAALYHHFVKRDDVLRRMAP